MIVKRNISIKNVRVDVHRAISKYCKEKGITQAYYLEKDRRIKDILG